MEQGGTLKPAFACEHLIVGLPALALLYFMIRMQAPAREEGNASVASRRTLREYVPVAGEASTRPLGVARGLSAGTASVASRQYVPVAGGMYQRFALQTLAIALYLSMR